MGRFGVPTLDAATDRHHAAAALPAQRGPDASGQPAGAARTGATRPGRVLLIDPDATAAQSFAHALTAIGIAEVLTAPNFESAAGLRPDAYRPPSGEKTAGAAGAVLAIVSMRLGSEVPGIIALLRAAGWARIIALSTTAAIGDIVAALAAGATGAVIAGRATPARNVPTGIYDLSPREVEVLRMVADGRSNKWIGERLELSALTVKSHLARIGRKLSTGDRAHMVTLALRAGVIS
jgi:DNA-binding NarL/FixJ family response regulator